MNNTPAVILSENNEVSTNDKLMISGSNTSEGGCLENKLTIIIENDSSRKVSNENDVLQLTDIPEFNEKDENNNILTPDFLKFAEQRKGKIIFDFLKNSAENIELHSVTMKDHSESIIDNTIKPSIDSSNPAPIDDSLAFPCINVLSAEESNIKLKRGATMRKHDHTISKSSSSNFPAANDANEANELKQGLLFMNKVEENLDREDFPLLNKQSLNAKQSLIIDQITDDVLDIEETNTSRQLKQEVRITQEQEIIINDSTLDLSNSNFYQNPIPYCDHENKEMVNIFDHQILINMAIVSNTHDHNKNKPEFGSPYSVLNHSNNFPSPTLSSIQPNPKFFANTIIEEEKKKVQSILKPENALHSVIRGEIAQSQGQFLEYIVESLKKLGIVNKSPSKKICATTEENKQSNDDNLAIMYNTITNLAKSIRKDKELMNCLHRHPKFAKYVLQHPSLKHRVITASRAKLSRKNIKRLIHTYHNSSNHSSPLKDTVNPTNNENKNPASPYQNFNIESVKHLKSDSIQNIKEITQEKPFSYITSPCKEIESAPKISFVQDKGHKSPEIEKVLNDGSDILLRLNLPELEVRESLESLASDENSLPYSARKSCQPGDMIILSEESIANINLNMLGNPDNIEENTQQLTSTNCIIKSLRKILLMPKFQKSEDFKSNKVEKIIDINIDQAQLLHNSGKHDEAIDLLNKNVEILSSSATKSNDMSNHSSRYLLLICLNLLTMEYFIMNNYTKAHSLCEKILKIDPFNMDILHKSYRCKVKIGDKEGIKKILKTVRIYLRSPFLNKKRS